MSTQSIDDSTYLPMSTQSIGNKKNRKKKKKKKKKEKKEKEKNKNK